MNCKKCFQEMKIVKSYYRNSSWTDGNQQTLCLFFYPHVIWMKEYMCEKNHKYILEIFPDEKSDKEYRTRNAEIIKRQKKFILESYK